MLKHHQRVLSAGTPLRAALSGVKARRAPDGKPPAYALLCEIDNPSAQARAVVAHFPGREEWSRSHRRSPRFQPCVANAFLDNANPQIRRVNDPGRFLCWTIVVVVGALLGVARSQDMRQTPHDLRGRSAFKSTEESALCVFCHAPIGERQAAAEPPRWQPSAGVDAGFAIYALPMNGPASGSADQGASMICLSCHDASQAPNISGGGSDHPVGVRYAGAAGFDVGGVWQPATIDAQARAHQRGDRGRTMRGPRQAGRTGFRPASRSVIDERVVWWVPTSRDSSRRTRYDLPLYGDVDSAASDTISAFSAPTIECGTCHDPHSSAPMFLRIPNSGSRLCLSCHDV